MTNVLENSPQNNYIQKYKKHKRCILLLRFIFLIAFLCLWEIFARFKIIDSFFFASPSIIYACFLELLSNGTLLHHIGITLIETLVSFFIVIICGIGIATILWFHKNLSEIIEPYLVILNSLPKSALAPLFIVWLGTGMKTIIIAGISVAIFGCIITIYHNFQQVNSEKVKLIYTLGGRKIDGFLKVIFPSCIPVIISTMKVNIGLSLVGVIIGEFLAARQGLGYLIIYGSQVFQLNLVITSIIILCIIAMGLYQIICQIEKHYIKK